MQVTTAETLLPVPYTRSLASMGDRAQSYLFSRHPGPHSGIVFVGDEQGRTRVVYDHSGRVRRPQACLGQIIDLYV